MKSRRVTKSVKPRRFRNLSLKTEFCDKLEAFINENPQLGYRSLAQFFENAGRELLKELKASEAEEPRLRKLNADENGVKIWDTKLRKSADVFFKPSGIRCILDDSSTCVHVYFALTIPEVRDIIRAKRREGWKLPDV
jgi:hypothetical protein